MMGGANYLILSCHLSHSSTTISSSSAYSAITSYLSITHSYLFFAFIYGLLHGLHEFLWANAGISSPGHQWTTTAMITTKKTTKTKLTEAKTAPVMFLFLTVLWSASISFAALQLTTPFYVNIFLHILAATLYLIHALIHFLNPT